MKVIVTGATRGIGHELVAQWLSRGDQVVATYRNEEGKRRLESAARSWEGRLRLCALDVRDEGSVRGLAAAVGTDAVDVLVNNAGVMGDEDQGIEAMNYDAWADVLNVNTLGPFRVSTSLLPSLRRSERPRIITLSSIMGCLHRKSVGYYAYRTSKTAVNKVMQLMAHELRDEKIVVCPVNPGWVRTEMGGAGADLSVAESAAGIVRLVDSLTLEESGRLWQWDGSELPW